MSVGVRAAVPADREAVERLLTAEGLPLDGVDEHFATFLVAEEAGAIVGAAGLEVYEDGGLLRSVVVAPHAKGRGLGRLLTQRLLDVAEERGLVAVYLLTTTAADYFPRLGFERISREQVPAGIQRSRELTHACPTSATVMRKQTRPRGDGMV